MRNKLIFKFGLLVIICVLSLILIKSKIRNNVIIKTDIVKTYEKYNDTIYLYNKLNTNNTYSYNLSIIKKLNICDKDIKDFCSNNTKLDNYITLRKDEIYRNREEFISKSFDKIDENYSNIMFIISLSIFTSIVIVYTILLDIYTIHKKIKYDKYNSSYLINYIKELNKK